MNNLELIKSVPFGALTCDIYQGEDSREFYMTREQIGRALEYADPQDAVAKIHRRQYDRLEKFSGGVKLSTPGGVQETTVYSNKGIMEICRFSRQPKADAFMDFTWAVMDSLIKGEYQLVRAVPQNLPEALRLAADLAEKNALLEDANAQKLQIIGELKPKADYTDTILQNKGLVTITQIAKDYGMSGQAMNVLLHELGIQYKQGSQWLLYAKYHDKGYTHSETIDIVRADGRPDIKMNTKWTQKGRLFLYNLLKSERILPTIEQDEIA